MILTRVSLHKRRWGPTWLPVALLFRVWAPQAALSTSTARSGVKPLMRKRGIGCYRRMELDIGPDSSTGQSTATFTAYLFVVSQGSTNFKDPYARELAKDQPFPNCSCILFGSDFSLPAPNLTMTM